MYLRFRVFWTRSKGHFVVLAGESGGGKGMIRALVTGRKADLLGVPEPQGAGHQMRRSSGWSNSGDLFVRWHLVLR